MRPWQKIQCIALDGIIYIVEMKIYEISKYVFVT